MVAQNRTETARGAPPQATLWWAWPCVPAFSHPRTFAPAVLSPGNALSAKPNPTEL